MIEKLEEILKTAGEETYRHSQNVEEITKILFQNELLFAGRYPASQCSPCFAFSSIISR